MVPNVVEQSSEMWAGERQGGGAERDRGRVQQTAVLSSKDIGKHTSKQCLALSPICWLF